MQFHKVFYIWNKQFCLNLKVAQFLWNCTTTGSWYRITKVHIAIISRMQLFTWEPPATKIEFARAVRHITANLSSFQIVNFPSLHHLVYRYLYTDPYIPIYLYLYTDTDIPIPIYQNWYTNMHSYIAILVSQGAPEPPPRVAHAIG